MGHGYEVREVLLLYLVDSIIKIYHWGRLAGYEEPGWLYLITKISIALGGNELGWPGTYEAREILSLYQVDYKNCDSQG